MEKSSKTPLHFSIKDNLGKDYPVPAEGSLGLLALGYKGLMAWRAKRSSSVMKSQPADKKI